MTKTEFLDSCNDIVSDKLYFGKSTDDINEEISNNMWSFSIPEEIKKEFTIEDLNNLFIKIVDNRKVQVIKKDHSMKFYLWYDEQAFQLRFNLISAYNDNLPFSCNYVILNDIKQIFKNFLKREKNYISWDECKEIDFNEDESYENVNNILEVYMTTF